MLIFCLASCIQMALNNNFGICCQFNFAIFQLLSMLCFLEFHSCISTYTGLAGILKLSVFTAVTQMDGLEVHYDDSTKNEHISKQNWMKTVEFKHIWKEISAYHDEVYRQLKKTFDVKKKSYNKTGECFLFLSFF